MRIIHRSRALIAGAAMAAALMSSSLTSAQDAATPSSRTALIEETQAKKATQLHPFEPGKAERLINRAEAVFLTGNVRMHPFFESAYAGGGFTLGAGYMQHVSAYNLVDFRGSITFSGYKRIEAMFLAPRLFDRRGVLTAVGGWREATQVGFYGIGTANTSKDDRANYAFKQPYASALLEYRPTRRYLLLRGGAEVSTWDQGPGSGAAPSVDEVYTPETLSGLGASPTYVHPEVAIGFDSRTSPGYTRSGGLYTVTFNQFHDTDGRFGFQRTDYEAIQHIPILRDTWVLALHGRVEVADASEGQAIPFFMLPALGGGSSLRGFPSWRFRDRNSLLVQAEWRVLVNRFLDMALFYDAGRVAAETGDLTDAPLKSDYGLGFRVHSPLATPLRIELAKSNEGLAIVFSAKAPF